MQLGWSARITLLQTYRISIENARYLPRCGCWLHCKTFVIIPFLRNTLYSCGLMGEVSYGTTKNMDSKHY